MNSEYVTIDVYVETKSKLLSKVEVYDNILEKMEIALLLSTESGHINQYELDDGQMKVRSNYRSVSELVKAISGIEKLRQMYINRHNGRISVLRGGNL